ncbi:MAG TPA: hypothetical protein PKD00_02475, partial [Burkholderiales bacterium]|nr:hypothetical protein [Burkholderiales bacterium]
KFQNGGEKEKDIKFTPPPSSYPPPPVDKSEKYYFKGEESIDIKNNKTEEEENFDFKEYVKRYPERANDTLPDRAWNNYGVRIKTYENPDLYPNTSGYQRVGKNKEVLRSPSETQRIIDYENAVQNNFNKKFSEHFNRGGTIDSWNEYNDKLHKESEEFWKNVKLNGPVQSPYYPTPIFKKGGNIKSTSYKRKYGGKDSFVMEDVLAGRSKVYQSGGIVNRNYSKKKYQTAGSVDENQKIIDESKDYHGNWIKSNMHDDMLKKSIDKSGDGSRYWVDPKNGTSGYETTEEGNKNYYNKVKTERNNQLNSGTTTFVKDKQELDNLAGQDTGEYTEGFYDSKTDTVGIIDNNDYKIKKDNTVHEDSHRIDKSGTYMPASDKDLIKKKAEMNGADLYQKNPTEVRARLNVIRENMNRDMGIDVFNQPITKEQLQQYLNNNGETQGLKDNYTEDSILEMLNTISYQNNNNQQVIGRYGGKRKSFRKITKSKYGIY